MPTIAPADSPTARRLQRSIDTANLTPPASNIAVLTPNGGNVFEVSDALKTAYDADLIANPAPPAEAACRTGNPCYASQCGDTARCSTLSVAPNTIPMGSANTTIVVTGSGFVDGDSVWFGPVGGPHTELLTTFLSGTQLSATINSSMLLAAGARELRVAGGVVGEDCTGLITFTITTVTQEFEFPVTFTAKLVLTGFDAEVTFTDGPPNATFTLHWGDGNTSPVTLDGNGDWAGSHTYTTAGTYTTELHDDDGVVGSRSITVPSS